MTKLRVLGLIGGVLLLIGIACAVWILQEFNASTGTDVWQRDGAASGTDLTRLLGEDYPSSISRVVENGHSSRFNGDGEELVIFCFATADLPKMQQLLGDGSAWVPGLPNGPNWRHLIDSRSPQDLKIAPAASAEGFVHVEIDAFRCTIIDTVRGISYRVIIQT